MRENGRTTEEAVGNAQSRIRKTRNGQRGKTKKEKKKKTHNIAHIREDRQNKTKLAYKNIK